MKRSLNTPVCIVVALLSIILCINDARAQGWPEVFEPNVLLTVNLQIDPADWRAIMADGYLDGDNGDIDYEYEVPAWFWADGEESQKLLVSVRHKSCDPIPAPGYTLPSPITAENIDPNLTKISLKIDINQYIAEQDWHDLIKLSLENGDDMGVMDEGVSWNIHRLAGAPEGYNYDAARGNWVRLYVNGIYYGVYVSPEQRDKRFLQHRNLYIWHNTWLYKLTGGDTFELAVGDDINPASPAVKGLCFVPFAYAGGGLLAPEGGVCPTPEDANLVAAVEQWVDTQGMLAMAAANAFIANTDALFTHYQNSFFQDFDMGDPCETRKRMYFPWDLDSALGQMGMSIYNYNNTTWQQIILGNPTFRSQYNHIIRELLNGPLQFQDINDVIDLAEPVLLDALAADQWTTGRLDPADFNDTPANRVTQKWQQIRDWVAARIEHVTHQVDMDEPQVLPGTVLLEDNFEGAVWDANWNDISHNWLQNTGTYAHGSASAWSKQGNAGNFTCDALDASDATAIHVDFFIMKNEMEAGDIVLYYYDGTGYNLIGDLNTLGQNDIWLHYSDTITDSNYFVADFRIRFNSTPDDKKEDVWIDTVSITKETPMLIWGCVREPNTAPMAGIEIDANNGAIPDVTDATGYYEIEVPFDWSGDVTSVTAGYSYDPLGRRYDNVQADQENQDFTATKLTYTISGNVGLDGVVMNGLPGDPVSSGGGIYTAIVDYGWSGTVTPTKENYSFAPSERIYSSVTGDQPGQDYTAGNNYDLDGDGSIGWGDVAVFCGNWLTNGPEGDFNMDGSVNMEDFAEFGLVW